MRWVLESFPESDPAVAEAIQGLGLHPAIQQILRRFPFPTPESVERFLKPSLKYVEPPECLQNLTEAVAIVDAACKAHRRIAILSDYDVDGITSLVLMERCFKALNYTFVPFFPDRETEGYGLTEKVVERVLNAGPWDLLIALDCGTNSVEAIHLLKQAQVSTVVLDHHQKSRDDAPEALIVNPHLDENAHSLSAQSLCTAGLVFKFIHAWMKRLKQEGNATAATIKLRSFLDLVALGTIADMVPIRHENRLWVAFGLKEMAKHNLGLQKLLQVSGCALDEPISPEDVSFKIAPRINVSGRLQSAQLPYQLLTQDKAFLCESLARQLDQLNGERQAIEHRMAQEADAMIALQPEKLAHVLFQPHWHIGVVGIVAGRLTRKWHRPIFILGDRNGLCKGSGRSIPEINLVPMFTQAQPWLEQWGGHPAAVGLSVMPENIAPLEAAFNAYLKQLFPQNLPEPQLPIAATLTLSDITPQFLSELSLLGPFGQGNEAPIFILKNIALNAAPERFGKHKEHLRFKLNRIEVLGWRMAQLSIVPHEAFDFAVRISEFPPKPLQLQLLDAHPAAIAP